MKLLYENIQIPALKGDTTIAHSKLFLHINSDFKNWETDKKGNKTNKTILSVYEMDKDGTLSDLFNSLSKDTESLVLTQAQILEFVENHKDKLRTDGFATFFLFKVGEKFFVAHVDFYARGGLEVYVYHFSLDYVWLAEYRHRLVVKQLKLKPSESLGRSDTLTLDTSDIKVKLRDFINSLEELYTKL